MGKKVGLDAPRCWVGCFAMLQLYMARRVSRLFRDPTAEMHRQVWECRLRSKARVPVSRTFPVWMNGQRRQWWMLVDTAGRDSSLTNGGVVPFAGSLRQGRELGWFLNGVATKRDASGTS